MRFTEILFASFLLVLCSCNQSNAKREIPLTVVRQSSNLIHCDVIFASSVKKMEEENEIFIQLGTLDTNDEELPKQVAIVRINDQPVFLYNVKTEQHGKQLNQDYTGDGYTLTLSCNETDEANAVYDCTCTIKKGSLKSEYRLKRMPNHHDY